MSSKKSDKGKVSVVYKVVFATERIAEIFQSALQSISDKNTRANIMDAVLALGKNPRPFPPNPKLDVPLTISSRLAQYRIRAGDYRVFYDVNDVLKKVYVIAL